MVDQGRGSGTPIAFFAYARPEHTRASLEALMACNGFAPDNVSVFADGPRTQAEVGAVREVRRVARSMLGPRATYHCAPMNRGLAASVIAGVTSLCDTHERVIVVEDDLVVSANFLRYMHTALDEYADDETVMQVSGHMFEVPAFAQRQEVVALPFVTSWGWGTWRRAWRHFDRSAPQWAGVRRDRRVRHEFNVQGAFDYATLLDRQIRGEIDSWAIMWNWAVFRRSGLCIYPPRSLVHNIGFDGSGTHLMRFPESVVDGDLVPTCTPHVEIVEDELAAVRQGLKRRRSLSLRDVAIGIKHMARARARSGSRDGAGLPAE